MAFTTVEVQQHLDALKELLNEVGPTISRCLVELIVGNNNGRRITKAEALQALAKLAIVVSAGQPHVQARGLKSQPGEQLGLAPAPWRHASHASNMAPALSNTLHKPT